MKHKFYKSCLIGFSILLCLLINNFSQAQPGWFWQNPLPQGNTLRAVKFINTTIGWAVGYYGTILKPQTAE